MSIKCGTVLNEIYRVVRLLGAGSMGNVYLVDHIKDDKKFVIKELLFKEGTGIDKSKARDIFFREAGFMGKFSHRGIPAIYGTFSKEGKDYLIMDYIEGKTLEDIIKAGKVRRGKAIKWTIELAEILDYLHNSFHTPIIYRDLKPSNIIITPEDKPVLVDFGIARYYNPDKNTDTFSYGSPGYAAPEQYKGRGQSSPQTDVFGLGVILFQMLTEYDPTLKPFTFPPMKLQDEKLENTVKRAIELDPLKRYISVAELKESLEKYLGIYKSVKKEPAGLFSFSSMSPFSKVMTIIGILAIVIVNILYPSSSYCYFSEELVIRLIISCSVAFAAFILWLIITALLAFINKTYRHSSTAVKVSFLLTFTVLVLANVSILIFEKYSRLGACMGYSFFIIFAGFCLWALIESASFMFLTIDEASPGGKFLNIIFVFLAFTGIVYFFSNLRSGLSAGLFFFIFWTPLLWFVFYLLYAGFKKVFSGPEERHLHIPSSFPFLILAFFMVFASMLLSAFLFTRPRSGQLAACESNLKNIATALEMYATDNCGDYPTSLSVLTAPVRLFKITEGARKELKGKIKDEKLLKLEAEDHYYIEPDMILKLEKLSFTGKEIEVVFKYLETGDGGSYMKALPNCPVTAAPYLYEVSNMPDNFTLCCGAPRAHISTHTVSIEGNWPQYTPGEGLKA